MKKFAAFLMALTLCLVCFGTYGFASASTDDVHGHTVNAADDNAVFVSEFTSSYKNGELKIYLSFGPNWVPNIINGSFGISFSFNGEVVDGSSATVTGKLFGQTIRSEHITRNDDSTRIEVSGIVTDNLGANPGYVTIVYDVNERKITQASDRKVDIRVGGSGISVEASAGYTSIIARTAYVCTHPTTEERVIKEATCQTVGEKVTYCSTCQGEFDKVVTAFSGHSLDTTKSYPPYPYVEATCTTRGSGYFKCTVCGVFEFAEVDKLPHHFGVRYQKTDGVYYQKCTDCGTEAVAENQCDHNKSDYVLLVTLTAPTCTSTGLARYQCPVSSCKQTEERELDMIDHTLRVNVTKVPTCTETGIQTTTCTTCNYSLGIVLPMLDHEYSEWTVKTAGTCVTDGVESRRCVNCFGAEETRTVAGTGHSYGSWNVSKASTCLVTGEETRTCFLCGDKETRVLALSDHTYGVWSTTANSTCVAQGVQTHYCTVCNHADTQPISINPDNHKYGEWTTVTAKTCTVDGTKQRVCADCNAVDIAVDACVGHVFGTPTVDGKITQTVCGVCQYTETVKTVKNGTEKTLTVPGFGALVLRDAEALKKYTFDLSVPDAQTEAYYRQYLNFYKAYTYEVSADGAEASVNGSMDLIINLDSALEDYEVSVVRLYNGGFYPVTNFERKDGQVTIPGGELAGADVVFLVQGAEYTPSLVVPIIVTVATLLIAGAAIYIFLAKNKRRGF